MDNRKKWTNWNMKDQVAGIEDTEIFCYEKE